MAEKLFGTDGIRGTANIYPMTADVALKAAMATAQVLDPAGRSDGHVRRVVIGKDTRLSGYMIEQAIASGFVAMGMDVLLAGPIPTPAVAMLTRSLRADVGVMISASHNPYQDNGIKLFGADGYKLGDALEAEIERLIADPSSIRLPPPDRIGKASRLEDVAGRYVEYIKGSLSRGNSLEGLKIVIDCAHGAAYRVAPQVLWELEAEVIGIGVQPDGRNINAGFGATDTAALQRRVVEEQADIGIALDGDADRLIMVDEMGNRIDGDQLMALLAIMMQEAGTLRGGGIVATVMSNLGLENFLRARGLSLIRTPVGDRNVVERMRAEGYNLGGEQSGHMIMADYGTTGDGLLAALQVIAALKRSGLRASAFLKLFEPLPQLLRNVCFREGRPLENDLVKSAIATGHERLNGTGRLLVRPSGTEPLIRVMAEGMDERLVGEVVGEICKAIEGVTAEMEKV